MTKQDLDVLQTMIATAIGAHIRDALGTEDEDELAQVCMRVLKGHYAAVVQDLQHLRAERERLRAENDNMASFVRVKTRLKTLQAEKDELRAAMVEAINRAQFDLNPCSHLLEPLRRALHLD